ncbi:MAG: hypothetical protein R2710_04205 [Acidimicrobiales bacterium]
MDTTLEELLRAYSPVTMARLVTSDTEVNGCPMHEGDHVVLNRRPIAIPSSFPTPTRSSSTVP